MFTHETKEPGTYPKSNAWLKVKLRDLKLSFFKEWKITVVEGFKCPEGFRYFYGSVTRLRKYFS